MNDSKIEWTDSSVNLWVGCSMGCDYCYARHLWRRMHVRPGEAKQCKGALAKLRKLHGDVFVNPHSDFFDPTVPDAWRDLFFFGTSGDPILDTVDRPGRYFLLTKRPEVALEYFQKLLKENYRFDCWELFVGVTVTSQPDVEIRLPLLEKIKRLIRCSTFVSCEPLISGVDMYGGDPDPRLNGIEHEHPASLEQCWDRYGERYEGIDWVIAGCEKHSKVENHDWYRSLRDQCEAAQQVPFFLKQMVVDGKVVKMPELDGKVWAEKPLRG